MVWRTPQAIMGDCKAGIIPCRHIYLRTLDF